jgi:hypothetical protein
MCGHDAPTESRPGRSASPTADEHQPARTRAAAELGLSWPPTDTWHRIVGHAIAALDAIGDELDLAGPARGCSGDPQ